MSALNSYRVSSSVSALVMMIPVFFWKIVTRLWLWETIRNSNRFTELHFGKCRIHWPRNHLQFLAAESQTIHSFGDHHQYGVGAGKSEMQEATFSTGWRSSRKLSTCDSRICVKSTWLPIQIVGNGILLAGECPNPFLWNHPSANKHQLLVKKNTAGQDFPTQCAVALKDKVAFDPRWEVIY